MPEDDNRSVVQNFHLEHPQPPFRSTPIPRSDDVRQRDRIRQRHSRSNQTGLPLNQFEDTVQVLHTPWHWHPGRDSHILNWVRGFESKVLQCLYGAVFGMKVVETVCARIRIKLKIKFDIVHVFFTL